MEDVAASISAYEKDIEDDPNRLAEIEDRLDLITRSKRKYGSTIEEILQRMIDDQEELDTLVNRDDIILKLKKQDGVFRQEIGQIGPDALRATLYRRSSAVDSHGRTA